MKKAVIAIIVILFASFVRGDDKPTSQTASGVPPLQLVLEIAGQSHTIVVGQEITVEINGKKVPVRVSFEPRRGFEQYGVKFNYPANFTWKQDDKGGDHYVVEGRRSQLELTFKPADGDAEKAAGKVADKLERDYKRFKNSREKVSTELGGMTLNGTRLEVLISGKRYRQDIYGIDLGKTTCILMIQDTPESGKTTEEAAELMKMLRASFEISPRNAE